MIMPNFNYFDVLKLVSSNYSSGCLNFFKLFIHMHCCEFEFRMFLDFTQLLNLTPK